MPQQPRKPALTIVQQISLLAARGLVMTPVDEQRMARLLSDRSFSRMAEYWRHFETGTAAHQFSQGTTVADIAEVYEFDAGLRRIIFDGLGVVEIALRSRLGYHICTTVGAYIYLNPATYIPITVRRGAATVYLRDELIADLGRDLDRSKEDFIVVYRRCADMVPLWTAMEVLSMGSVSNRRLAGAAAGVLAIVTIAASKTPVLDRVWSERPSSWARRSAPCPGSSLPSGRLGWNQQ